MEAGVWAFASRYDQATDAINIAVGVVFPSLVMVVLQRFNASISSAGLPSENAHNLANLWATQRARMTDLNYQYR